MKNEAALTLDSSGVVDFARQIENSVVNESPDFYDNAFDTDYIRQTISDNSIVYSSLDTDYGKEIFNDFFHEGEKAVAVIKNGGDFKFIRCYCDSVDYHVVFRYYDNFTLNYADYSVHLADNKIRIKDGFIYNVGTTYSNWIRQTILMEMMLKTNPEGAEKQLTQAEQMIKNEQWTQACRLLHDSQSTLDSYPVYWQLYLSSLYKSDSRHFISSLDKLCQQQAIDIRTNLMHKFMYYFSNSSVKELEEIIDRMISYTGDDPVYLLFYGKANYDAGNYKDAEICYGMAMDAMPLVWDLWQAQLTCLAKQHDTTAFAEVLKMAEHAYGMDSTEQRNFSKKYFPEMIK